MAKRVLKIQIIYKYSDFPINVEVKCMATITQGRQKRNTMI